MTDLELLERDVKELERKHNVIVVAITEEDASTALAQTIDQGDDFPNECRAIVRNVWDDPQVRESIRDAYSTNRPLLKKLFNYVSHSLRGWGIGYDDTEFRLS